MKKRCQPGSSFIRVPSAGILSVRRAAVVFWLFWAASSLGDLPRIEFFHEPGCDLCQRVESEILTQLEAGSGGLYRLEALDTGVESNYLRLAWYQEHIGIDPAATVVLVVNGTAVFQDWPAIRDQFLPFVGQLAAEAAAESSEAADFPVQALTREEAAARGRRFTVLGVAAAGLADGVNPCALSTLVFFISMLSVLRIRGPRLAAAGVAFCAASFGTYLGIGFGLFRIIRRFAGFHLAHAAVEAVMLALLLALAALSARDALRYARTGRGNDMMLRLPDRLQNAIHRIIRRGLSTSHLIWGGAWAGALVTLLESVCTGQVYLPTLMLMVRGGGDLTRALPLLLLYNTLFILPLVLTFFLMWRGLRTERLLAWSRRNVVPAKLALSALFIGLAVLMFVL